MSLIMNLYSCSSKVDDVNDENGNATFEYNKIEVVSSESLASDKLWPDLKDKFVVDLRTCFKDTVYLQNIVGEDFDIKSDLSENSRTTDANGCLNWTEEFEFNFLNNESYVELNGSIIGDGNYKGKKNFKLAVNPWSGKIVDLAFGSAHNIHTLEEMNQFISEDNALEVEDFTVEVSEKQFFQDKTRIKLDIMSIPQIVRKDLDGAVVKQKLSGGEFKVIYHLISKTLKDEKRKIISTYESVDQVRLDGKINSIVEFEITQGLDPNSIVELGVEIQSNEEKKSLGYDSGVMAIKDLDHRFSGKLLDLDLGIDALKSMKSNELEDLEVSQDSFGFIVEKISISKGAEGGANLVANNTDRRVNAIFKINMVDSLILSGIKNHLFNIKIFEIKKNGELAIIHNEKHTTMSSSGNMEFTASIPFRSYDRRDYKSYLVKVEGINNPYKGIIKERLVYINPWINGAEFGIDDKFGVPQKSDTDNIPQIFIPSVSYDFVGNKDEYKLNKALDLKMVKTLKLELKPMLKVDHSYSGNNGGFENIVTGTYKLRFLILSAKKNANYTQDINLDDFYTLTAAEKEVQVENGKIVTFIDLPMLFTDQLYYSFKNVALVELTPVDVDAELQKGYFVGPMIGMVKNGKIDSYLESGIDLSSGNIDIAKTLIERIDEVKHKLPEDYSLKDNYKSFTSKLSKHSIDVDVFNNSTLKVEKKKSKTSIFDSEKALKIALKLRMTEAEITQMILHPEKLSPLAITTMCHLLFNESAQMKQYMIISGTGYSMGSTQEFKTKGYLFKKCKEEPGRFVDFRKLTHVYNIIEQPKTAQVISKKLANNRAYFTSEGDYFTEGNGDRNTNYTSQSVSLNIGGELSKFGFFGGVTGSFSAGKRHDVYSYNQFSNTVSTQFRTMNSNGYTFEYDKFNLSFKVQARNCLLIASKTFQEVLPDKYVQTGLAALIKKKKVGVNQTSDKRYYICTKNLRTQEKSENWYFINLDVDSTMGDNTIPENAFNLVMRGDGEFELFRQKLLAEDEDIIFNESKAKNSYKNFKSYLEKHARNVDLGQKNEVGFDGLLNN